MHSSTQHTRHAARRRICCAAKAALQELPWSFHVHVGAAQRTSERSCSAASVSKLERWHRRSGFSGRVFAPVSQEEAMCKTSVITALVLGAAIGPLYRVATTEALHRALGCRDQTHCPHRSLCRSLTHSEQSCGVD